MVVDSLPRESDDSGRSHFRNRFATIAEMQFQNSCDLGNRLWIPRCTVIGWDDQFGLGGVQMRAPICDHPVTALRGVSFSAVANDGVIRNAPCDRYFVY